MNTLNNKLKFTKSMLLGELSPNPNLALRLYNFYNDKFKYKVQAGGKDCGKSWNWIMNLIHKITTIPNYNAVITRKLYGDFRGTTINQFIKIIKKIDSKYHLELYNGFGLEDIELKLIKNRNFVLREIYWLGNQKIVLASWDNPNSFNSISTTDDKQEFFDIYNEEPIQVGTPTKIDIPKVEFKLMINNIFRTNHKGKSVYLFYNPTEDNWIYNDYLEKYLPWKNDKNMINQLKSNDGVVEVRNIQDSVIVQRVCYLMNPAFNNEELRWEYEKECVREAKDNQNYIDFEMWGKPYFNYRLESTPYYDSNILSYKNLPYDITDYQKYNYIIDNIEMLNIGFDFGDKDRSVLTLSGILRNLDGELEYLIVLNEFVIEKNVDMLYTDKADLLMEKLLDFIGKYQFKFGDKLPIIFNYSCDNKGIVQYIYKKVRDADLLEYIQFDNPQGKNIPDWNLIDKHTYLKTLLSTNRIFYLEYPSILINNIYDFVYADDGFKAKDLRDADGWDSLMYSLWSIKTFIY